MDQQLLPAITRDRLEQDPGSLPTSHSDWTGIPAYVSG